MEKSCLHGYNAAHFYNFWLKMTWNLFCTVPSNSHDPIFSNGDKIILYKKNKLPSKLVKSNAWKERRREEDEVEDTQGLGLI